jgi:hypothetical protein
VPLTGGEGRDKEGEEDECDECFAFSTREDAR